METACQLRLVTDFEAELDDDPTGDRAAQCYGSTDGYPRAVVTKLAALADLLARMRSFRDPGRAASQYQFFSQLRTIDRSVDPGRNAESAIRARTTADLLDVRNMQYLHSPVFLTDRY